MYSQWYLQGYDYQDFWFFKSTMGTLLDSFFFILKKISLPFISGSKKGENKYASKLDIRHLVVE